MVLHLYMGDAGAGSRVWMQAAWTGQALVLARSDNRPAEQRDPRTAGLLDRANLWRALGRGPRAVVFHEQASLRFLPLVLAHGLVKGRRPRLVYDMHDLNEARPKLQYFYFRYLAFYAIEWLVSRLPMAFITVSQGLAQKFQERYGRNCQVVYNASGLDQPAPGEAHARPHGLVFFGRIVNESLPADLLRWCGEQGLTLDLHGPLADHDPAYRALVRELAEQGVLRLFGPYSPRDLSFLDSYRYSLIYRPSSRHNIRYCLPNKLFQSLVHGLAPILSPNLVEARELLAPLATGLVVIERPQDLEGLAKGQAAPGPSPEKALEFLAALNRQSRQRFLAALDRGEERPA